MEVDAWSVSRKTIKLGARVTDFPATEFRHGLFRAFLSVMDMIALPEWAPDLVGERTGSSGRSAEIARTLRFVRRC
ncbi:hypothetical protein ACVWY5_006958 [Bradyrhizobium sp. USDA 3256]